MLAGSQLLDKVRSLKDASKSDIVRACGFVSEKQDGTERLNFTAFYEALLEAKGVELGQPKSPGRSLTYKAKLQSDGKVIVGSAYLKKMNLDPDTVFDIEVGRTKVVLTAQSGTAVVEAA